LPDLRSYRNGDELVQILIEIPKKLTEKQKTLLREFSATEDGSAMPQRRGFMDKLKEMFKGDE
jgi:molecular chaperone DnaJ